MSNTIQELIAFIRGHDGINSKAALSKLVADSFELTKDRSVFYSPEFAIRFSSSNGQNFGNTVLSLSNLQKVDDRPFIVCLVTPTKNYLLLANSTFLKKISHSSQELRENNIRGSFNGSDIMRVFESIANQPENFERLYNIHAGLGFEGNLPRLVEATTNISPSGMKYAVTNASRQSILTAPQRASTFVLSKDCATLKAVLDKRIEEYKNEILLAAFIENVNVRGRIIEYLIAGEDELLRGKLVAALKDGSKGLPEFKTKNSLGDYSHVFKDFHTETDIKTKIMVLDSNPKAYNIDKILEFLASSNTVFMFYFVGVDTTRIVNTVLVSMFQTDLLRATVVLRHWAGRSSRGVTQFEGKTIGRLINKPNAAIDEDAARTFLEMLLAL